MIGRVALRSTGFFNLGRLRGVKKYQVVLIHDLVIAALSLPLAFYLRLGDDGPRIVVGPPGSVDVDALVHRIEFDAGAADALTYVLTHEATHVVQQGGGSVSAQASRISPARDDARSRSRPSPG